MDNFKMALDFDKKSVDDEVEHLIIQCTYQTMQKILEEQKELLEKQNKGKIACKQSL